MEAVATNATACLDEAIATYAKHGDSVRAACKQMGDKACADRGAAIRAADLVLVASGTVTLERQSLQVPDRIAADSTELVPFHAGEAIGWRLLSH